MFRLKIHSAKQKREKKTEECAERNAPRSTVDSAPAKMRRILHDKTFPFKTNNNNN